MKLFHMPNTRSARVVWCAHEAGVDIDIHPVDLRKGETKTPEYRAIHPLGKVPGAQLGGQNLFESGALCQILAEKSTNGFLPADEALRARCYTLAWFAVGELDRKTIGSFLQIRFRKEEDRDHATIGETETLWTETVTPFLSQALGDQPYLLGQQLTLADVMAGYTAFFAGRMGWLDDNLDAWVGRLSQRPGFQAGFSM